jgi:hypothetical protein
MEQCQMSRFRVGDTVAFRREVARKCNSKAVADYRGTVTEVAGDWLFMTELSGHTRVMPAKNMSKVARNGAILELV